MMLKDLLSLILFIFVLITNYGHTETSLKDTIDSVTNRALEEFNVPGIAIGVTIDNRVVLVQGYGFRDLDQKLPVTKNTLFGIGSCTKAFTSFLLGQLVDEGKLNWDDPVIKHIPEFRLADPYTTYTLTIRDLLAHRSGLARHDYLWANPAISKETMIKCLPYLDVVSTLRDKFQYSNLMYGVAGIIIERVTGQPWEQLISSRILSPLEMRDTLSIPIETSLLNKRKDFSLPYAEKKGKIQTIPFRSMFSSAPSAAISSSVADMIPWIQLQLSNGTFNNQNFINEDTLDEMHTIQMPMVSSYHLREIYFFGYGLGWFTGIYRGNPFLSHDGCIDGFISQIALLPKKNVGLVVLSNSSDGGSYAVNCIINTIFDKILGINDVDWIEKAKFRKAKLMQEPQQLTEGVVQSFPPRPLQEYVGHYEHPAYGIVHVQQKNDELVASYGEMNFHLSHKCYDAFKGKLDQSFTFANPQMYFAFLSNLSGNIYELQIPFEPAVQPIPFKRKYEQKN